MDEPLKPRDPALDAETDQVLAALRNARPSVALDIYARAVARSVARQHPGMTGLGRILVEAAQALNGAAEYARAEGNPLDAGALIAVLGLAGSHADRMEQSRAFRRAGNEGK